MSGHGAVAEMAATELEQEVADGVVTFRSVAFKLKIGWDNLFNVQNKQKITVTDDPYEPTSRYS